MKNFLRSKLFMPVAAALVCGAVAALAANTTFFTSIGDIVFPFKAPTTNPAAPGTINNMTIGDETPRAGTFTTVTADQVNAALGAYATNPASSASYRSYVFANDQTLLMFTPTGTVAYIYVTLAAAPQDGQQNCVFSAGTITSLFLVAGAPAQTIVGAITAMTANTRYCYTYSAGNNTWVRSQ